MSEEYDRIREKSWWQKLLLRLLRNSDVFTIGEDPHCTVVCICEERLFAGDWRIVWCPECGRGYSTEFKCYRYPARLVK